jgi:hypothetical protein
LIDGQAKRCILGILLSWFAPIVEARPDFPLPSLVSIVARGKQRCQADARKESHFGNLGFRWRHWLNWLHALLQKDAPAYGPRTHISPY